MMIKFARDCNGLLQLQECNTTLFPSIVVVMEDNGSFDAALIEFTSQETFSRRDR